MLVCINLKMRFLNNVLAWFPAKITFNKDTFKKIL